MTDRPITFSGPMVRALLEGRKTQTRRLFFKNAQMPDPHSVTIANGLDDNLAICRWRSGSRQDIRLPYTPGDRLWVKEAWRTSSGNNHKSPAEMHPHPVDYLADETHDFSGRYRHARFMPRWASRLTLMVTDVRVQRLQEISHEDAIREGVECATCVAMRSSACHGKGCPAAKVAFRDLWNSLHGPDAWGANPWVVAISFTVEKKNIDS